jgi:hypothetical protein
MTGRQIRAILLAAILASFAVVPDPASSQVPIVLPNVTSPTVTVPIIVVPIPGIAIVSLPSGAPSVNLLNTLGLPPHVNLPINTNVLLVNLPGVSILVPTLAQLSVLGNSALGLVLNQVAPINQLLASTTSANLLGPVDTLLNGLASGDLAQPGRPMATVLGSVVPLSTSNVWMWNAVTVGRAEHDGFQFQTNTGVGPVSGSTLPTRSIDKAELPGVLWDTSSLFGLKRGMLHFGITAGVAESDIQIKSDAILRAAGITQAGSAKLTSYSLGGFALLTTGSWYTGTVVGSSWGHSEVGNFLLGATSDYNASSLTSALILGTIVPLTDTIRFDVRSTLGYQRTVGDSHFDTLGIGYGEHVIEAVNGTVSGRMFGAFHYGEITVRPYLQAGVAHRFLYDNALQIEGTEFSFSDAKTSLLAATGVDFEIGKYLQLSAGVREERSRDFDILSARFGIVWRPN